MSEAQPADELANGQRADVADGRNLRRERNAQRLYETANELFREQAFADVSVDDICRRSGIGRATFFRIYGSKSGLLREFNRRLAEDAAARLEAAGDVDIDTGLDLVRQTIIDAWADTGPGHLGMALDFTQNFPSRDVHAAHPELRDLVHRLIVQAIRDGQLGDAVPAHVATALALLQLTIPVAYRMAGVDVDIDRLSRVLLAQWLAGSRAPLS